MPPLVARIFAVLCLAATYWMFTLARPEKAPEAGEAAPAPLCAEYPRGFRGATLAMEFVQSPEQVDCIVSRGARRLRPELVADRVTIALYWSILTCLSLLYRRSGLPGARGLGAAAASCATAGAVADLIENRGIGLLLDGSRAQEVIDGVRIAAYWKWGLLALAFALLAWFLFRQGWWTRLHAALFLLSAAWTAFALLAPGKLPRLAGSVSWITYSLFATVLLLLLHPRSLAGRAQPAEPSRGPM